MASAVFVLQHAEVIASIDKQAGINMLQKIVGAEVGDIKSQEQIMLKEQSIMELAQLFSRTGRAIDLGNLIKMVRPFLNFLSKAKAAKIVRTLVDLFLDMKADTGMEMELCRDCITWAKTEKRLFLRQALEVRLMTLLYDYRMYAEALKLSHSLSRELGKMDDKLLLIEVQLTESIIYYAVKNLPKAKSALTSAKITATVIYCPPKLQATMDLQSGILHAAIDNDFKTAYSYFYEAFEGYDPVDGRKALNALKYMLLSKIMLNLPKEVQSITISKRALKYAGPEVKAMKAIADATIHQSLSDFERILLRYREELMDDPVIRVYLKTLYDTMLEQNLLRILQPYSRVQIEHISQVIGIKKDDVEEKLSHMILDKKLNGILDQEAGVIVLLDDVGQTEVYGTTLETVRFLSKVVDALYHKATKLS